MTSPAAEAQREQFEAASREAARWFPDAPTLEELDLLAPEVAAAARRVWLSLGPDQLCEHLIAAPAQPIVVLPDGAGAACTWCGAGAWCRYWARDPSTRREPCAACGGPDTRTFEVRAGHFLLCPLLCWGCA